MTATLRTKQSAKKYNDVKYDCAFCPMSHGSYLPINNPKVTQEIYGDNPIKYARVKIYYDEQNLDNNQQSYPVCKEIKFALVNNEYWVQMNGGPMNGLHDNPDTLGNNLLETLNNFAGKKAKYILNPFDRNVYKKHHFITMKRWGLFGSNAEPDW